ncbi:DUF4224 domain-containing protein [uncultured Alcanivorax sp.]|uniref:DUF4224 domain-containing protein n=1 Tax=uncultured Alcanivorax sp. TaxID=191215 RepID=UPI0030D72C93
MTSMRFLTEAELEHLTGYRAPSCQRRELLTMGIRFFTRPKDGHPVVLHEDVAATQKKSTKGREPAWQKAS